MVHTRDPLGVNAVVEILYADSCSSRVWIVAHWIRLRIGENHFSSKGYI